MRVACPIGPRLVKAGSPAEVSAEAASLSHRKDAGWSRGCRSWTGAPYRLTAVGAEAARSYLRHAHQVAAVGLARLEGYAW